MNKEARIEGVIFDWAGTIIDYGCFAPMASFIDVFKKKEIDITIEEARTPMGMMKRDHIKAICQMDRVSKLWKEKYGTTPNEEDIDELFRDFQPNLMEILKDYCDPIPGALDLVKKLKEKNIKIGSTTGYTSNMMEIVEKEAKKKGYEPDSVVNSSDVPKGRPYPYMIWKNAINLELDDLSKVVKVGDTIADIKEGINSKVWTVGVLLGSSEMGLTLEEVTTMDKNEIEKRMSNTKEKFINAGAHYTIDDISKLDEVIELINERLKNGERPTK